MGQSCTLPICGVADLGALGKDLSVGGLKGGLPRGASRLARPQKQPAAGAAEAPDPSPPAAPSQQARTEAAVPTEDVPRQGRAGAAATAGPSAPSAPARGAGGPDAGRGGEACEDMRCGCRGEPRVPEGLGLTGMSKEAKINYTVVVVCLLIGMTVGVAKQSSAVCLYIGVLLVFLVVGDLTYSRFLANTVFRLSDDEVTPAHQEQNLSHPDFTPTPAFILLGHHWTSITGAAPIIGPALACYYGWLPAMLWVVFGALFAGSVHDFGVLVLSARMGGRSIGDLAGTIISWRARVLLLLLILFLCWIVVAVFMNAIATLFMSNPETVLPVNAEIPLAAIMGVFTHYAPRRMPAARVKAAVLVMSLAALVFLYGLVFAGVAIERNYATWEDGKNVYPVFGWALHAGEGQALTREGEICADSVNFARHADGSPAAATCAFGAKQFWTVFLTLYAFIVSVLPVWVVLQPRDFINSHQLKACMALILLGLMVKGPSLDGEAIRSVSAEDQPWPIWPMLFTTVACGSVSGFHGLVSSGVTSKQLDKMRDARPIGYCAMLGEGALAALVIVICCSSGYWSTVYAKYPKSWGNAFIPGAAGLLTELGLGKDSSRAIIIVLVVSFAATTLDSGMRIQRVLVSELGNLLKDVVPSLARCLQNVFVSAAISAVPACLLANSRSVGSFWNLFAATNQFLACVSLITVAIYVGRLHDFKLRYVTPILMPVLWLTVVISWALVWTLNSYLDTDKPIDWFTTVPSYTSIIIAFLIATCVFLLLLEAVWYFASGRYRSDAKLTISASSEVSSFSDLRCC